MTVIDGNHAAADVAYRASEVIAIYPITPASPMGELCDAWSARGRPNLWRAVPRVTELQSEGGAAGAIHGALVAGALATTFTSSQGLLLMIPNMYRIAGELLPCVIHVAARALATHALSIFGDHSDVYAARSTGFAILGSCSPQEAHDLAAVAHAATLSSRVPFLHFFDGFRTSHELTHVARTSDETLVELIDRERLREHRARALTPDRPSIRGTAHNPDTYFQAREAVSPFYRACPSIVQETMDRLAASTGRSYRLVEYRGSSVAERVVVVMGSASQVAAEAVARLCARGEDVGVLTVRLYRPFPAEELVLAMPSTVRRIAVLDRAKEPGSPGEPLFLDVAAAVAEHLGGTAPAVTGGRFGLSSKELTPAMIERVFFELDALEPKRHFTLGIRDDVSRSSLDGYAAVDNEPSGTVAALVYGRGSDGTVSACHSTLRIVGEDGDPPRAVQGYFVYDSHKSGTVTVSHLRFSDSPIEAPYLVQRARFIGIHQWSLLERFDVLDRAADDGLVLVNAPLPAEQVWDRLPREAQEQLIARRMQLFAIDAQAIARELGLGARIGTIMQACFFAVAGLLPVDRAVTRMREEIGKSYQARGAEVIEKNRRALSLALERLASIPIPDRVTATRSRPPIVAHEAPRFVQRVTALMLAGKGDLLPVSAFPPDGTWPTGTARWEKRDLAQEIPVWNSDSCIQCNKCATVCPHAAIRAKVYPSEALVDAPAAFQSVPFRSKELRDRRYTIQVAPEDCTGCALCVAICPAHDGGNGAAALAMTQEPQRREAERACFEYFLELPEIDRREVRLNAKHVQLLEPLFEFPGACAGCGEAPYLKLLTQLFGDRMLIANATGCSSIYGGNLPTTPYTSDRQGRGPAWANSLFEDNAEFGVGMRLAVDRARDTALQLVRELRGELGDVGHELITAGSEDDEAAISAQRARVRALRALLAHVDRPEARTLEALADYLVPKTVWIVGGDGWAYDIGFGGLDHVLASGEDVNVLVLDTECYSNTGGQTSKATPLGAVAKFSARGKASPKKDLALLAMSYGDVYVARVAFGADDQQTVKALLEAQSYRGPSLVIAYSHCIAQGYDLREALDHQRLAVDSGHWPLFRHDPRRRDGGLAALQLDSRARASFDELARREDRFRSLASADPERAGALLERAQRDAEQRGELYRLLATLR